MVFLIIAIGLLTGSIGLLLAAVAGNQIDPSYSSALAIPIANLASLVIALLATPFAVIAYGKNDQAPAAKPTMVAAATLLIGLALLFPLSDLGYLSRVQ